MSKTDQQVKVLRVAIFPPAPPAGLFDYLPLPDGTPPAPGCRVRIMLGRRRCVGVVMESVVPPAVAESRLRRIDAVLDEQPVLLADLLKLLRWTAGYYQYPLGKVLRQTVPRLIRRGDRLCEGQTQLWTVCADDGAREQLAKAPRQRQVFDVLLEHGALSAEELAAALPVGWRRSLKCLLNKGLVTVRTAALSDRRTVSPHRLNSGQTAALERILSHRRFQCHLLEGVTGSGKTEVYLRAAEAVLDRGAQILVLVPEIGLTSQTVERFHHRFGAVVSVFHSGLSEQERLHTWSRARSGAAKVFIGTRSAMFLPFSSPALIVVDEEHDLAYKQQDSLRYHARDLAIKRAQLIDVPVVLGSATPSLESLRNAADGHYLHHHLRRRAGGAGMPVFEIIDLRGRRLVGGVSEQLTSEIGQRLARDEQVLLFLNRRGYATQLLCHDCGEVVMCTNCDTPLVYHLNSDSMRCHHCDHYAVRPERCKQCAGTDLKDTGIGTERIEEQLQSEFPQVAVTRVDADSVRHKGALGERLKEIRAGGARIIIGTQMLSKGHHFPAVTLVGIVNVDQRLFAPDFRALERLGQLVVQVAGRAGRGALPGKVCLQTHHPDNPHLLHLVGEGYAQFARHLLAERRQAHLPPYHFFALLRAAAGDADTANAFLKTVRARMNRSSGKYGVSLLGPAPMMLEKRGGQYRAQLLVSASRRTSLSSYLSEVLPAVNELKGFRRVTWHLDVDPMEFE